MPLINETFSCSKNVASNEVRLALSDDPEKKELKITHTSVKLIPQNQVKYADYANDSIIE